MGASPLALPGSLDRDPTLRPGHVDRSVCLSVSLQFEGGRSTEEIRKFWQNYEHPSINKQEWSEQEVAQLKAVAAKHGHLDWQRIAEELGVRVTPRPGPALGAARGSALATREGGWRRSEAAWTTPPPADAPKQPRCSARSVPFPSLASCSCSGVCFGGLGRLPGSFGFCSFLSPKAGTEFSL